MRHQIQLHVKEHVLPSAEEFWDACRVPHKPMDLATPPPNLLSRLRPRKLLRAVDVVWCSFCARDSRSCDLCTVGVIACRFRNSSFRWRAGNSKNAYLCIPPRVFQTCAFAFRHHELPSVSPVLAHSLLYLFPETHLRPNKSESGTLWCAPFR